MNTINYYSVMEQTREEKIAMYKKLSKEELIAMLLENQRLVEVLLNKQPLQFVQPNTPYFNHLWMPDNDPYYDGFKITCSND